MNARFLKPGIFFIILFSIVATVRADDYVGTVKAEKILVTTTAGDGQKHVYLKTERPAIKGAWLAFPRCSSLIE